MGNGEHPLPHGHQVRGALGHAPAAARGAEAPPLTRERQQPFERAITAPDPGEAVRQHPAVEELPELADDERWQPNPVRAVPDRRREVGPVPADDAVEHARRRRARDVDAGRRERQVAGRVPARDARSGAGCVSLVTRVRRRVSATRGADSRRGVDAGTSKVVASARARRLDGATQRLQAPCATNAASPCVRAGCAQEPFCIVEARRVRRRAGSAAARRAAAPRPATPSTRS
jgi:hypothetical protein